MNNRTKHTEFLKSAAQWKFDSDRQPLIVRRWQITNHEVPAMWEDLHQNFGFDCLLTWTFNQGSLENAFGQFWQMHGCSEMPNTFKFVAGPKHTLAGRLIKLLNRENCEVDTTELLNEVLHVPASSGEAFHVSNLIHRRCLQRRK